MPRLARTALALLAVACGDQDPGDPGGDQAAAYEGYANAASIELARYRTAMAGATVSTCAAIHGRYELAIHVDLERMAALAPELDTRIAAAGGTADLACGTTQLFTELMAHDAVACSSGTLAGDQAEATRHIDAMTDGLDRVSARSEELSVGLAGGGYTWTAASGCP